MDLRVSHTLGSKDKDEVNRREFQVSVSLCDGWVCDLEAIGVPSIFQLIRGASVLTRMFPTLDLRCEENVVWRKWKFVCATWTPEVVRKRSVSRWVCKNKRSTNLQCRCPTVLGARSMIWSVSRMFIRGPFGRDKIYIRYSWNWNRIIWLLCPWGTANSYPWVSRRKAPRFHYALKMVQ